MSSIIETVETFIQRIHDMYYIIDPKAMEIIYGSKKSSDDKSLSDELALHLEEYESEKNNENLRLILAQSALLWINRAFSCGVVQEGKGLVKKLEECKEKNIKLENDLEKLSAECIRLQELTRRIKLPDGDDLERAR